MNRVSVNANLNFSRRGFIGGLAASLGTLGGYRLLGATGLGTGLAPKLKLGVITDIHIYSVWNQEKYLEKVLRWYDAQGVDAVMVPGDIAHNGLIAELTSFARIWYKVFPGDKGADGRPVEKLFITGNHDLDPWWMMRRRDNAWLEKNLFCHGDNPRKVWKELFHEDWHLIWKKVVKGYTFIGAQWPRQDFRPPIESWFRDHAAELRGARPFFYTQHAHPRGTCGDGKISCDDGSSTRVLSAFPNAVAITGHSHQTLVDESSVWQGTFTSINAGCLRTGANDRHNVYDSTYPFYSPKKSENRMIPLSGEDGKCGLLVDVFDDHLLVHRRAFECDLPLGDAWYVALPSVSGGPFDPRVQHARDVAPEFPAGAKLEVVRCAVAPKEIAGPALSGKPCVWLKIPHPAAQKPTSRVYDFSVEMFADGACKINRLILAHGFNLPVSLADRPSHCLFGADEVPAQGKVSFRVTPRTALGSCGRSLVVDLV